MAHREDSLYLQSLIFLSYSNSCNRRSQPKSVPWRQILTQTRSRRPESLRRSPLSTLGRRWLENRKLCSNNGDFLPGCEGRSQAGCSSGDETAQKKSHRVQTLHVWTFWRKKSSSRRRRCWWWGRHQTTTNGRIINNSLWPPLQDVWPLWRQTLSPRRRQKCWFWEHQRWRSDRCKWLKFFKQN